MVELKSKNHALESEIREYENKLEKILNDNKQLLEKVNYSKNLGKLKFKYKYVFYTVDNEKNLNISL